MLFKIRSVPPKPYMTQSRRQKVPTALSVALCLLQGISAQDIKKLKDGGYATIRAVMSASKKHLTAIKVHLGLFTFLSVSRLDAFSPSSAGVVRSQGGQDQRRRLQAERASLQNRCERLVASRRQSFDS